MIIYVGESNGFYVGRYETSLDATKNVQSKKGLTSATASDTETNKWYGLYNKQKTYNKDSVGSSMIWGCQYDKMLMWIKDNGYDVTVNTPKDGVSFNESTTTGVDGNPDVMNNINDLIGCHQEWTLEAYDSYIRTVRGYPNWDGSPPVHRNPNVFPYNSDNYDSSRLTLYVK